MQSIRSRLVAFLLRNRHLLKGQLKRRSEITRETSIPRLRLETEKSAATFGKVPPQIACEPCTAKSLAMEWLRPPEVDTTCATLYFHGGGYVIGSIRAHRAITAKLVCASGVQSLLFDYRRAPEHPFPAAIDDAMTAWTFMLDKGIDPSRSVFMGDSAGGGLALAALLACKKYGHPLPGGAVALSPWTDLTNSGDSWNQNAERDNLCWREAQIVFADYYGGDTPRTDPLMSPLFGDLSGLPPLLLFAGGDELMRDDTTRFAQKARESGVTVREHIGEGLFHCYPAMAPLFPEAKSALEEIGTFIRNTATVQHKGEATVH